MSFGSKSLPAPTAEQLQRLELIRIRGCICCVMQGWQKRAEIHHLKSGNVRMGHDYTIGLCPWHHRGEPMGHNVLGDEIGSMHILGPSLAKGAKTFHREYGQDEHLLEYQNRLIGWTVPPKRERARRNGSPTAKPVKLVRLSCTCATDRSMTCIAHPMRPNATRTTAAPDSEPTVKRKQKRKRGSQCTISHKTVPRSSCTCTRDPSMTCIVHPLKRRRGSQCTASSKTHPRAASRAAAMSSDADHGDEQP